jgi:DNA-binding CsgD family transcriptional regulator
MECSNVSGDDRPAGTAVLVGRDRELRQMMALFDAATAGGPVAVIVEGPPASGRTRLLDEFGRAARRRGASVILETEWVTAVDGAKAATGARLAAQAATGESAATRTSAAGAGLPLVFVSDRPGRIDARVWAVVEQLADTVPVLVVVTVRAGVDRLPVDGWGRAHRVRLAALSPGDVAQLARLLIGARPGPELSELCRVAAGRPGVVRELILGLQEEGLVKPIGGRAVLSPVRLPGRTRRWLLNQLAGLSPQGRHLVQAATTLRSPFPLVRLTRLLGTSPVALIPAIDEVLESGLLTGDNEMLRFGHDLVREVVESSIPRPVIAALRQEQSRAEQSRPDRGPRAEQSRAEQSRPDRGPWPGAAPGRPARPEAADWSRLTARELQIAELAGQALTNQQIAGVLGRTTHTVNYHLRQIFQKLSLNSRVELAVRLRHRETEERESAERLAADHPQHHRTTNATGPSA